MEGISLKEIISSEKVLNKIYLIRGVKVMLDRDLAVFYEVETRVLNQAVNRNSARFPEDFMFQLSEDEFNNLMSQIVISSFRYMIRERPAGTLPSRG
ncbi:MAG: hypothetical protein A2176_02900 [Spirochaetes bacterium RBG_13_51_14]|nr:MAG: hypothetical protein A2176_02900 [Spirochaetes bacterium RBG_13_51_14]